jgi:hypothetical protein
VQGGIFHLIYGQAMGFEGAVVAQVISIGIGQVANIIEAGGIEYVTGANETPIRQLKAQCNHQGGPSKRLGVACWRGTGIKCL